MLCGAALLFGSASCVSQKTFDTVQKQYQDASTARDQLQVEKTALQNDKARNEESLRTNLLSKNQQVNQLNQSLSGAQQENSQLSTDLRTKEERIAEMQRVLDQKDAAVRALRQKVGDALLGFNSQDLQVNVRNGKVYVSLSEQLLFKSGSTTVDPKGQDALKKLATALKGNQDVNVLVEGHTDNVPLRGVVNGAKDNWDLSVLRATEITRILTEAGLPDSQVTPSGRAQFVPIAANDTPANKALNRRTEIILTPKLDELFQILEQN